jgi:hypothetical protein
MVFSLCLIHNKAAVGSCVIPQLCFTEETLVCQRINITLERTMLNRGFTPAQ